MKVTLWQQFSSNHSANFVTVGQFESAEWASTVAKEIRDIIREIGFWWEQYETYQKRESVEKRLRREGIILTPPEQRICEQYQVEWCGKDVTGTKMAIDWIRSQEAENAVYQHRDLVIIYPAQTWCGAHPFAGILRKLGGNVASRVEDYSQMTIDFTFAAPNAAIAAMIENNIRTVENNVGSFLIFPNISDATHGSMTRTERHFVLSDVHIRWKRRDDNVAEHFEAIMQFIEKYNCTDITYKFHETITRNSS